MTGRIIRMKPTYAFIKSETNQTDYFFLPTALQKTVGVEFKDLHEGQRVEFEPIEHPKGLRAVDVRVLR